MQIRIEQSLILKYKFSISLFIFLFKLFKLLLNLSLW